MPHDTEDMIQLLLSTNKEQEQTIVDLRATIKELRSTIANLRKKNGLVPVSHRLFVEVFVSGNKSCLYGYDVPDTSIYQKDHWTGIPGSDPTILYLYVLDFF